ncbi:hypothetical protein ANN_26116 [Periplaneta americana]|uniref:Uncharacterized protein n=1 Tax=Periplaneta americana TaxID=6978 RepID=A0ABQ8S5E3_PERAM|nr:hypothetical protein ANN_26116 [Periplaneta americana]
MGVNEGGDIHHYTWLETEMARDANEVSSAVLDYIKKLEEKLEKIYREIYIEIFFRFMRITKPNFSNDEYAIEIL